LSAAVKSGNALKEDTAMHPLFRGTSVIPVLTIEREARALPLARALYEGGLKVIEVTFRTEAAAASIAAIARELPQVTVGAGTLLRAKDVGDAVRSGAKFLVSPGATPELAGRWRPNCPICQASPPRPRSWRRARSAFA
jgi:2-dehydro-3-deoxyphosphogluconate aldolase/(4S)-4-hydroxy-2-oxoglutarate aldolase